MRVLFLHPHGHIKLQISNFERRRRWNEKITSPPSSTKKKATKEHLYAVQRSIITSGCAEYKQAPTDGELSEEPSDRPTPADDAVEPIIDIVAERLATVAPDASDTDREGLSDATVGLEVLIGAELAEEDAAEGPFTQSKPFEPQAYKASTHVLGQQSPPS